MRLPTHRLLSFAEHRARNRPRVGTVHPDGSITYAGRTYRSVKEVPAGCVGFRADLESLVEWRRLYRAVTRPWPRTPPPRGRRD